MKLNVMAQSNEPNATTGFTTLLLPDEKCKISFQNTADIKISQTMDNIQFNTIIILPTW